MCLNVDPRSRKNCGFGGITEAQCIAKGCCYDEKTPNVPHCFHALPEGKASILYDVMLM